MTFTECLFDLLGPKSGRKREPKPKLFGPDIFQWGRGLPRERVGAKKFDTSLETREIKLFGRDIPRDFAGISRGRPKRMREKRFGFNFWLLTKELESQSFVATWQCLHRNRFVPGKALDRALLS